MLWSAMGFMGPLKDVHRRVDTVANASGAGTLARRLVAGPRMDRNRRWQRRWNGTSHTIGRWAACLR